MKKIMFLYNWVPQKQKCGAYAECAGTTTLEMLRDSLVSLGFSVIGVNLLNPEQLRRMVLWHRPSHAFVIAEGYLDYPETLYDGSGASSIRQILEQLAVAATHSAAEVMELCRNKDKTYQVLHAADIPVPRHFCFNLDSDHLEQQFKNARWQVGYPMFIKPTGGGNSIGIDTNSVVNDEQQLVTALEKLKDTYGITSILAETFLPGQEFTVGVMGRSQTCVLPIIGFPRDFPIRSNAVKKIEASYRSKFQVILPADSRFAKLHHLAVQTFASLGAKGIIRIDVKEDATGNPYVIDVNGTPSLSDKGSLAFMAENAGMTYRDLIHGVLVEQPVYQGTVAQEALDIS